MKLRVFDVFDVVFMSNLIILLRLTKVLDCNLILILFV